MKNDYRISKNMYVVKIGNKKVVWRVNDVSILEQLWDRDIIQEYENLRYKPVPGDIINYL